MPNEKYNIKLKYKYILRINIRQIKITKVNRKLLVEINKQTKWKTSRFNRKNWFGLIVIQVLMMLLHF